MENRPTIALCPWQQPALCERESFVCNCAVVSGSLWTLGFARPCESPARPPLSRCQPCPLAPSRCFFTAPPRPLIRHRPGQDRVPPIHSQYSCHTSACIARPPQQPRSPKQPVLLGGATMMAAAGSTLALLPACLPAIRVPDALWNTTLLPCEERYRYTGLRIAGRDEGPAATRQSGWRQAGTSAAVCSERSSPVDNVSMTQRRNPPGIFRVRKPRGNRYRSVEKKV